MDDDEELIGAVRASAKRQHQVVLELEPIDDARRARIAQAIVASYRPARTRRRRAVVARVAVVASGLALAASVALVMRPSRAVDELPSYQLVASGGARELRGVAPTDNGSPLRLRKGDRFEVFLRPADEARTALAARAFLVRRSAIVPFAGAIEVAPRGAVRVTGSVDDFPGVESGPADLVIAVGRPDAMRAAADSLIREDRDHRVLRTPVIIE